MTVRELINGLLDCNMDAEVKLFLNEPFTDENGKVSGYLFDINKIHGKKTIVELEFTDWRKEKEETKLLHGCPYPNLKCDDMNCQFNVNNMRGE